MMTSESIHINLVIGQTVLFISSLELVHKSDDMNSKSNTYLSSCIFSKNFSI